MPSRESLVSNPAYIGRKLERNGNKTGNGREPKLPLLCRSGNGKETGLGNETGVSAAFISTHLTDLPVVPKGWLPTIVIDS